MEDNTLIANRKQKSDDGELPVNFKEQFDSLFLTGIGDEVKSQINDEFSVHSDVSFLIDDEVESVEETETVNEDGSRTSKNPDGFSDKYFGPVARRKFFARYHWVNQQRKITNKRNSDSTESVLFDNESETGSDFPFAEVLNETDSVTGSLVTDQAMKSNNILKSSASSVSSLSPLKSSRSSPSLSKYQSGSSKNYTISYSSPKKKNGSQKNDSSSKSAYTRSSCSGTGGGVSGSRSVRSNSSGRSISSSPSRAKSQLYGGAASGFPPPGVDISRDLSPRTSKK